jgi:iron complex transport system permease protein
MTDKGLLSEFKERYLRYISRKMTFVIICLTVSVLAIGLQLSFGKYSIGFFESYGILIDHLRGIIPVEGTARMKHYVVWELRTPRALAGLAVGAGLGMCGAVMQSSLKNPLADPYTTGIASGAGLGAAIAIVLGLCIIPGISGEGAIVVNAFVFSMIPVTMIITMSRLKRSVTPSGMILIGIAVMYIFTATTTLLKLTASEESLAEVYMWSVGTLGKAGWDNIWFMIAAALTGAVIFQLLARRLNVLVMCDSGAVTLGVDPRRTRLLALGAVSLVTAVLVSFTGTIGFVGLVAPHMVRMFIGSDNKYLIPASAAFGALMLLIADFVARNAASVELPVGTITALIGGPLFLYLIVRQTRSAW